MRNERRIGGPLVESTGDRDLAGDGERDDGSSRRTAEGGLFVIRVGVGMVFVLPRDAGAEDQLLLEPGGGPLDTALVEQFEVDAAGFVLAEAVVEGVLQLIEREVAGAA